MNNSKKCIAIIPARSGSKRIPNKNIRNFLGKPIIAYSIETAIESNLFDEIMVSTDDESIAEISKKYGASIPFMRNKDLADDYTTTGTVILDVIEKYASINMYFDYICCIYATAPFVTADDLRNALNYFVKFPNAVQLIPLADFSYPPQRGQIIDKDGFARWKYPEYITTRSQDLEKIYHDIGQFYFFNTRQYIETKGLVYNNIVPYIMDEKLVQDIDTEMDWQIAEVKYQIARKIK